MQHSRSYRQYWLLFSATTAIYQVAPANAREVDAALPSNQEVASSDIVVTAQKRSQRTMDVPISITALSGTSLAERKITQSEQLADITPGLSWTSTSGKAKPFIFLRGVGNADYRSGTNSPVGTYIDGAYQGNAFGSGQLLLDIDRVEVLRGPQGTLWGKNTTGGLINYVPNLASTSRGTNVQANISYGNYDAVKADVAVGLPINDMLAVRLAAGIDRDDGYFRSSNPTTQGRFGGSNWKGLRASVELKPSGGFSIVGELNYSLLHAQAAIAKALGTFDPAAAPFSFTPCAAPNSGRIGSQCADVLGYVGSTNLYSIAPSIEGVQRIFAISPILKMNLEVGEYTIASLSAYNRSTRREHYDVDDTPSPLYEYNANDRFHSFSQEIRLVSPSHSPVTWMAGLYMYRDDLNYYYAGSVPVYGSATNASILTTKSQNYAGFVDGTYHVTQALNVTVGLRYTIDRRQLRGEVISFNAPINTYISIDMARARATGTVVDLTNGTGRTDRNLSGRVTVDYHINPAVMVYGTISRGFKGGDINGSPQIPGSAAIVGPEHLTAYEAGLKGSLVPGLLTFEASGFYYDYDDAQVYQQVGFDTLLTNAGKIRIYGADGTIALTPTRRLSLDAGYSFLSSKYLKYENPGLGTDYSGNRTPNSSKVQLSGRVTYTLPLADETAVKLAADAAYHSRFFFAPSNARSLSQGGYTLFNANASYMINKALEVGVYVRNLTNKTYLVNGFDFSFAGANLVFPGAPRTYGISVGYRLDR